MPKDNEVFEGLSFPTIGEEAAPQAAAEEKVDQGAAELEALRAQVAELTRQSARDRDRLISALAGRQPAETPRSPAQDFTPQVDIDLSDLPDATMDKAGFQKKLAEKIKGAAVAAAIQTTGRAAADSAAQSARNAAFDTLWTDFKDSYPELAPFDDIVEKQARILVEKAASCGLNADQYVLGNRDQFLEDVASATEARLSALGWGGVGEGEAASEPAPRRGRPRMDAPTRTAGTFGAGPRKAPAAKSADRPVSNMASELKDIQKKLGYM